MPLATQVEPSQETSAPARPRRRRRPTSPIPLSHFPTQDSPDLAFALRDPRTGTQWTLPHARSFVVGSGTEADVVVDRVCVSRKHCTIERRGAWIRVTDHSKNGSFLHGERLAEFEVAPGDHFRIGETDLTVATAPMIAAAGELAVYLGLRAHSTVDRALCQGAISSAIVLVGEDGTGHVAVANLLHGCSRHRARPLVSVNSAATLRAAIDGGAGTVMLCAKDFSKPLSRNVVEDLNERTNQGVLGVYVRAESNDEVEATIGLRTSAYDVISLPPLRARGWDVPQLVERQLGASRWPFALSHLGERTVKALEDAAWPGNLPELSRTIGQIAILLSQDGNVRAAAKVLDMEPASLRRLARRLDLPFSQARKSARSIAKRRHQRRT